MWGGKGGVRLEEKNTLKPWGRNAIGKRTRKSKKYSEPLILRHRKNGEKNLK